MLIRKSYLSEDLTVHDGERAVVAKICVPVVDRDGEVVMPQGCVSKDFEKNPIVFYGHIYDSPPVGKCVGLKRAGDSLVSKTVFASRPADHVGEWLPDTLFSLYQQGVLKGFSVGFHPIESRAATKGDRDTYGPNCKTVYSKWNLLEYSVAAIPANQDALVLAVSKGILTTANVKTMFGVDLPDAPPIVTQAPIVIPEKRKVAYVYQQKALPPEPVNVDAIINRYVDKRCGQLYSE
jgi:hypothetical protein